MPNSIHRNYVISAWISAGTTVLGLMPTIIGGNYSESVLRWGIIGLIVGAMITLLLSMEYSWMKWVMLCFSALGVISLNSLLNSLSEMIFINPISALTQLQHTVADIIITVILFKTSTLKAETCN